MKNLALLCSCWSSAGSKCRQRTEVFHFCADYTIGKQTLRGRSCCAGAFKCLQIGWIRAPHNCMHRWAYHSHLSLLHPALVQLRIAHSSSCGLCWFLFSSFIWHLKLENSLRVFIFIICCWHSDVDSIFSKGIELVFVLISQKHSINIINLHN